MASKPADAAGSQQQVKEEPSMADVYSGHELTPLQKHAAFFDQNRDDIIYPSETYQGLHAIGCGVVVSTAGAVFINGLHAAKTVPANVKPPAFKFPIYVKTIQQGKHGSDTDVYDTNGRFVPEKFEEIFKKHAHTRPDALTSKELGEMLKANRDPKDFKGRVGAFGEWRLLYFLCKDKEGFLHKETMKAVYDGSVFEKLEREKKQAKEFAKKK
ncbi:probable peroxygenase 5 [Triticum aestivum]|uniref:probable peroxygenase 5 n=1 Tax=Triticum aestivum TaxID=4565 RepID=UPI001D0098D5|nr:probable peroxygenase 5 [Triticum aestivum]